MAESTGAKRGIAAAEHSITVSVNGTPNPLTTNAGISDTITFVLTGAACYLWTWDNGNAANVFANQSGNYLSLATGVNGPYSINTSVVSPGDSVTFQTNANPPSEPKGKDVVIGVKGTIQISSVSGNEK